jgi:WD40 repeat protein
MGRGTIVAPLEPGTWDVSWCGDVLVTLGAKGITWRQGATGTVVGTAPALTRPARVICAPDGARALAYGYGVEVWSTGDRIGRKLTDRWAASAAWGPGNRAVLGFEDAIEIWRLGKGAPARELRRRGGARVLAWRPDGLIAADIEAQRRFNRDFIETGLSALRASTLSPSGRWLDSCVPSSMEHCDRSTLAWSPDGTRLATIVDGVLSVVDTPLGPRRSDSTGLRPHRAFDVAWNPDGTALAAADGAGVLLIRLRDGATVRLRDIRVGDRLLGLVDDGHGRFCGDDESSARVVRQPSFGSSTRPLPDHEPNLLERFLR